MTRGRILYVEDNLENRILIKRILEAEGYAVIEAENGAAVLRIVESAEPDLILMDINLPDIDGYECTARLRQVDRFRKIPIVALTANVMEGDRQKALDAGCDGYIPKPIDVDHLPTQVAEHLRSADSRRAVGAAPPPPSVRPAPAAPRPAASLPPAPPAPVRPPPSLMPPPPPPPAPRPGQAPGGSSGSVPASGLTNRPVPASDGAE